MRLCLKLLFFSMLFGAVWFIAPASANQLYFVIISDKGKIVQFPVTEDVVNKVGTISFKALLPGMDDKLHDVRGPLMRDLLKLANAEGQTAFGVALDKYQVDIPTRDFTDYDVIAAVEVDGKPISVREKGPAWIVYPSGDHPELQKNPVYEARSMWQIKELTIK